MNVSLAPAAPAVLPSFHKNSCFILPRDIEINDLHIWYLCGGFSEGQVAEVVTGVRDCFLLVSGFLFFS